MSITIDGKKYSTTLLCNDKDFIKEIYEKKNLGLYVLNREIPMDDYLITECTNGHYDIDKLLSSGGYNDVYSIKDNPDKVLRILSLKSSKTSSEREDENDNELKGLFMQCYFSKKCNNICKVYEFGTITNIITKTDKRGNETKERNIHAYSILERLTPLDEEMKKSIEVNDEINKKIETVTFSNEKDIIEKSHSNQKIINFRKIFKDILNGLSCIHKLNYVHLDIKEYNIGIDNEQHAKIFDFGSATYIGKEGVKLGYSDSYLGTARYEAPEVFRNNSVYFSSDVFSVGIIMLKLYYYNFMKNEYFLVRFFNVKEDREYDEPITKLRKYLFPVSGFVPHLYNNRDYYDEDVYITDSKNLGVCKHVDNASFILLIRDMMNYNPIERKSSTILKMNDWFENVRVKRILAEETEKRDKLKSEGGKKYKYLKKTNRKRNKKNKSKKQK